MTIRATTALAVLVLSLAACSRYDPGKCFADRIENDPAKRSMENCLSEWGHKMATGPDGANVIAEAVVWHCRNGVAAVAGEDEEARGNSSVWRDAKRTALLHVAEERTGHCSEK